MTFQYQAESFGLSGEPEIITSVKKKQTKRINKSNQKEFKIEVN